MPTYPYFCSSCGHKEDIVHSIKKKSVMVKCPDCGAILKKGLGLSTSFILKGSGWPGKTSSLNRTMTRNNVRAEKRMRKEREPLPGKFIGVKGTDAERVAEQKGYDVVTEDEAVDMILDQEANNESKTIEDLSSKK